MNPIPVSTDLWMEEAVCATVDPELWYPEKGGSTQEAKFLCSRCPVAARCLEYALANQEVWGVWGGLSGRERRSLKRGQPLIPCKECGTEFVPRNDGEGTKLRRYCSNDCRKAVHRRAVRESDRRRSAA